MYAAVIDAKQSSIAPMLRVVRFSLIEGEDRRVFSTFIPNSAGELQKGDEVVLLVLPGKSVQSSRNCMNR